MFHSSHPGFWVEDSVVEEAFVFAEELGVLEPLNVPYAAVLHVLLFVHPVETVKSDAV